MRASHVVGLNNRTWSEIKDSFGPEIDEIHRSLSSLDGQERFSLILWRLPEGKSLDNTVPRKEAEEYIQAAGSADRMTVEVRRLTNDGAEQFVVGRSTPSSTADPEIDLPWSEYTIRLRSSEVFDSHEAVTLFWSYYETRWVPSEYRLRRLHL